MTAGPPDWISRSTASFACSAVRMGLTASAERLPRLIGESRAKPHLLTGAPFDAASASFQIVLILG